MRLGRAVLVLTALVLGAPACAAPWTGGIHAVLRYSRSRHTLVLDRVPADGPAGRAGLRADDEVVAIDGAPVSAMTEDDVRARLRGEVGTRVRLRVRRGAEEREVDVERAPYR